MKGFRASRWPSIVPLAGLLWLSACSSGGGARDDAVANTELEHEATANALENMANELENGAP